MGETAQAETRPRDTGRVSGRRALRFASIDELMAEVDRLADADRAGRLRGLGNWTLGQTLGHLARWVDYSFDGSPLKVPFFVRWIMRGRKQKFLRGSMPAGVRIPRVEGGTLATEPIGLDEGLGRMRRAMERLRAGPPQRPHMLFGPLDHEEWIASHLRHAELHLGFLVPE